MNGLIHPSLTETGLPSGHENHAAGRPDLKILEDPSQPGKEHEKRGPQEVCVFFLFFSMRCSTSNIISLIPETWGIRPLIVDGLKRWVLTTIATTYVVYGIIVMSLSINYSKLPVTTTLYLGKALVFQGFFTYWG